MKKTNRLAVGFAALVLLCVCLVGGLSAAATGGSQNDPLVTLSYLTQVVTPQLMQKVDQQVAANEQALTDKLNQAINNYSDQMKQILSQGTGESSSFGVVALTNGQRIQVAAGSELLLRSGNLQVVAGTSPVMLNATDGSSVEIGNRVTPNHLYVAPLDGVVLTATADAVLMVRGMYAVN